MQKWVIYLLGVKICHFTNSQSSPSILPGRYLWFKSHHATPSISAKFFLLFAVLLSYLGSESIVCSSSIWCSLSPKSQLNWNHSKLLIESQMCCKIWEVPLRTALTMHFPHLSIPAHIHCHHCQKAGRKDMPTTHLCSPCVSGCKCSNSCASNYSWQPRELLHSHV